ncbi:MAG: hypothetical protein WA999_07940 [Spirulinaceae cyanobacterium]
MSNEGGWLFKQKGEIMTNAQRLDKVEDELETVKLLLVSTARIVESNNQYLDEITDRIDRNAQHILNGLIEFLII